MTLMLKKKFNISWQSLIIYIKLINFVKSALNNLSQNISKFGLKKMKMIKWKQN